jgi:molybdenum cofactor cytidylyltransferase
VGGGGKTTSMFRLAAELSATGLRVISTTTTHISNEQVRMAPASLRLEEIARLGSLLDQHGHCLLIGPPDGKGRVFGASSELIASLSARPDVDVVLVEADGSRSLPLKAPGQHEPVVPEATTILAPLAGLNSIGQTLEESHVHRSELAAVLAQQPLGSNITPQTLARVLVHPEGGAKRRPAGARLAPILNKADTDAAMHQGCQAAVKMLTDPGVDTVILSTMQQEPPVRESWTHIAGIVLAAGKPARFGDTKQIPPRSNTTPAAHSVRMALDAGLDPVIVVLGYQAVRVEKTLTGLPVRPVYNSEFESGQSTSFRKGLEALPRYAGAAVFLLPGQPLVTAETIRALVNAHRQSFAPACVPVFEGKRGNPALFDRSLFRELGELCGDTGGRVLLDKYVESIVTVPTNRKELLDMNGQESEYRIQESE